MKRFITAWIILSAGLNVWQSIHIKKLEEKRPIVVYKADNSGAEIFGKVVEKGRHDKLYTITIRDYGVFVVTKEVYEKVKDGQIVEGKVAQWAKYERQDSVRVTFENGEVYYTHSSNVTLYNK